METWMPDRVHRFKNILAFLTTLNLNVEEYKPEVIESVYLRYLGPNLPSDWEYSYSLTDKAKDLFERYCEMWNATKENLL